MRSILSSSLFASLTQAIDTTSKVNVTLPVGPFQLKGKLYESFSGALWRVTDSKGNDFNMKTFTLASNVSTT